MPMIANRWSASLLLYGGNRGSMSQSLMQRLWQRGLHLLTGIRRNRKNDLLPCWTSCYRENH